jgi:hypothetical protein
VCHMYEMLYILRRRSEAHAKKSLNPLDRSKRYRTFKKGLRTSNVLFFRSVLGKSNGLRVVRAICMPCRIT